MEGFGHLGYWIEYTPEGVDVYESPDSFRHPHPIKRFCGEDSTDCADAAIRWIDMGAN